MIAGRTGEIRLLVDTLEAEHRLLAQLNRILGQQCAALEADNGKAVDDCMFAGRRILDTLRTAQRSQRLLVERLTGDPTTLLDDALTGDQSRTVLQLRERIGLQALALAGEIRSNIQALDGSGPGVADVAAMVDIVELQGEWSPEERMREREGNRRCSC